MNKETSKREIPLGVGARLIIERPAVVDQIIFRGVNSFGAFSYGNLGCLIYNSNIGRYVSIGQRVIIGAIEHPIDRISTHPFIFDDRGTFGKFDEFLKIVSKNKFEQKRTTIGNDVWIGAGAIIKQGVVIGDGAIVAAGAVVVKDVDPYTIVAGVPAKELKKRFSREDIDLLKSLNWWDYELDNSIIDFNSFSSVKDFCIAFEGLVKSLRLKSFSREIIELP